jgi:Ca-activated chloride channel family protein
MVRAISPYALSAACIISIATLSHTPARADKPIELSARFAQAVMTAGQTQRNYLRVALNGCQRPPTERTPVNVAFVIDRSGSMRGARIAQAREAAAAAVRRLDKNDIASVVIFDDKIDLLVQAQPVDDHAAFIDRIRQIDTRGTTAIHGAVTEGAQQVRHNLDPRRLNRVVLLSDGQANVGPRRPEDFAKLGRELLAQGISVSTIGLGNQYNEDLMLALARAATATAVTSAKPPPDRVFGKEFDDVGVVRADGLDDVELKPGMRCALFRDARSKARPHGSSSARSAATEHYVLMSRSRSDAAGDDRARPRARDHRRRRTPDHRNAGAWRFSESNRSCAAVTMR